MNNARQILIQIHAVLGFNKKTERDVDNFCSWIEVQVMTGIYLTWDSWHTIIMAQKHLECSPLKGVALDA